MTDGRAIIAFMPWDLGLGWVDLLGFFRSEERGTCLSESSSHKQVGEGMAVML